VNRDDANSKEKRNWGRGTVGPEENGGRVGNVTAQLPVLEANRLGREATLNG